MDIDDATKFFQKQLNSSAGSIVLLALLHQQKRPMYGYQIAQELQRQHGGELPMTPGALYPALRSLEKQQLLSSYSELSDAGRARKYYEVTKLGRAAIKKWRLAWAANKRFIDQILTTDASSAASETPASETHCAETHGDSNARHTSSSKRGVRR